MTITPSEPRIPAVHGGVSQWSQTKYSAGWVGDLTTAIVKAGTDREKSTYEWLIGQAGGWFEWLELVDRVDFVAGTYAELVRYGPKGF